MSERWVECHAFKKGIDDDAEAVLACWLAEGHEGPHYDEADDLTWQEGKPERAVVRPRPEPVRVP